MILIRLSRHFANGEGSIMGLNLEWKRFTTWNMNDFMNSEIQVLKEITLDIPVTANFMMLYNGLDYRKMAPFLDVISWDSYPQYNNDYESLYETMTENGFHHAVMCAELKKDKPLMLMESAPGLVNWHPYNKSKKTWRSQACVYAGNCLWFRYCSVFSVEKRPRLPLSSIMELL